MVKTALLFTQNRHDLIASREQAALLEQIYNLQKNQGEKNEAEIILGGGYIFTDTLLTNHGRNFGVETGDLAIVDNTVIVGKVSEVGDIWSKIEPFSSIRQKNTGRSGINKSILFSEIVGIGAGEMQGETVQETNIKIGDAMWWGENTNYMIGTVDKISKSDSGALETINIILPVPLRFISKINIVKP